MAENAIQALGADLKVDNRGHSWSFRNQTTTPPEIDWDTLLKNPLALSLPRLKEAADIRGVSKSGAKAVIAEMRLGLDPGGPRVLAAYQNQRRFDSASLAIITDSLNRLFSSNLTGARQTRDLGLSLVDSAPALKQAFALAAQQGISALTERDNKVLAK